MDTGTRTAHRALLFTLLALAAATPLWAHGDAVLKSERSSIAGGETLRLHGTEFDAGVRYRLRLVGALETYDLETVRADSAESFVTEVAIPDSVRPGTYRIEAVAPDGDTVARLDVTILATTPVPGEETTEPATPPAAYGPMPRADEIVVQRSFSRAGWGVIGFLVGLSAGLGLSLLRGRGGDDRAIREPIPSAR